MDHELDPDEAREQARCQQEWEEHQELEQLLDMARQIKEAIPSVLVEVLPENVISVRYPDNQNVTWRMSKVEGGWEVQRHEYTTTFTFDPIAEIRNPHAGP